MGSDLSETQKKVLLDKATEAPFSGALLDNKIDGNYVCGQCGTVLFSSKDKFESGSGWPSFSDVAAKGAVEFVDDSSHGMSRTEVVCSNCKGHLGHIFNDGPKETTGMRYCINSASLNFESDDNKTKIKGDTSSKV